MHDCRHFAEASWIVWANEWEVPRAYFKAYCIKHYWIGLKDFGQFFALIATVNRRSIRLEFFKRYLFQGIWGANSSEWKPYLKVNYSVSFANCKEMTDREVFEVVDNIVDLP